MAGKIFVTGDCHRKFNKLNTKGFPQQKELDKDDYLIICGDFGGIWDEDESEDEIWWMNWLDNLSCTVLFVDGNHENFDRLYSFPVEEWNGGKVHKIRQSVIHLMRGQIYEICGKKIFTMGGASSHDISGGILDMDDPQYKAKKKELDQGWEPYRIRHVSWWEEELPSEEELKEARDNLARHNNEADYIITHCCSSSTQDVLAGKGLFKTDILTDFLDGVKNQCKYNKWYFGHYHDNINVNNKEVLLYDKIIELGEEIASPTVGHPKYKRDDKVAFEMFFKGELIRVEGVVKIVDAWGTFGQADEPSYDIEAILPDGNEYLVKDIEESAILNE